MSPYQVVEKEVDLPLALADESEFGFLEITINIWVTLPKGLFTCCYKNTLGMYVTSFSSIPYCSNSQNWS